MKGRVIAIEGSDGAGKETQSMLLKEKLESKGEDVFLKSFPDYNTRTGIIIGNYLDGSIGKMSELPPYYVAGLYACNRLEHVDQLWEKVNKGTILIFDRYIGSNAYNVAIFEPEERTEAWKIIKAMDASLPQPDATMFLYLPIEVSQRYLEEREAKNPSLGDGEKDIHERNIPFLREVNKTYLQIAELEDWSIINCSENEVFRDRQDIHDDVYQTLKGRKII